MVQFVKKSLWVVFMGVFIAILAACESISGSESDGPEEVGTVSQDISLSDADQLILDGRAQIGSYGGQCKDWARSIVQSSYGPTIPSTAANQFEWASSSVATNMAQWRGSYANGRTGPLALSNGASSSLSVYVPNSDPQVIVLYASVGNVTATLTKGGTVLSVTTPTSSPTSGSISSSTVYGAGYATLNVQNNSGSTASGIVAVVISYSRFVSDWQTARRGDIMQMYLGPYASNRASSTPHTTLVQTDYNSTSGTCTGGTTTGCNWLDSNWTAANTVGAHNQTLESMIRSTAYSADYGFTIYRLN